MSFRNLFFIHFKDINGNIELTEIRNYLSKLKYGFLFKPKNYQDELISKIIDNNFYFSITSHINSIECDDFFDLENAYLRSLLYPKIQQRKKEQEFLKKQFIFLDDVIKLIFTNENVESVEVFISGQFSTELEDYNTIDIKDRCLSKALVDVYNPTKKDNYIGFKTTKFVIK